MRATFTSSAWFWSRTEGSNSASLPIQRRVPKGKENLSISFMLNTQLLLLLKLLSVGNSYTIFGPLLTAVHKRVERYLV